MTRLVAAITPNNGHLNIAILDSRIRGRPNLCNKTTRPTATTATGGCKHCADDVTDLVWKAGGWPDARIRLRDVDLTPESLVANLSASPGVIGAAHLADPAFAYATCRPTDDPHDRIDPVIIPRGRIVHFAYTRRCGLSDGTWYAAAVRPITSLCGQPLRKPSHRPPAQRPICERCQDLITGVVELSRRADLPVIRVAGVDVEDAAELADSLIQLVLTDPDMAAAMSADHAPDPGRPSPT